MSQSAFHSDKALAQWLEMQRQTLDNGLAAVLDLETGLRER
jgi:hypothetical protein